MSVNFDQTLDVKGAKCPMPLVKSRKALKDLGIGEVVKVVSTDRGSVPDFQGWAKTAKNSQKHGNLSARRSCRKWGEPLHPLPEAHQITEALWDLMGFGLKSNT